MDYVKVEGTAYRVHASVLMRHSPYWRDKLGDSFEKSASEELKDVSTVELDALLSILYPAYVSKLGFRGDCFLT